MVFICKRLKNKKRYIYSIIFLICSIILTNKTIYSSFIFFILLLLFPLFVQYTSPSRTFQHDPCFFLGNILPDLILKLMETSCNLRGKVSNSMHFLCLRAILFTASSWHILQHLLAIVACDVCLSNFTLFAASRDINFLSYSFLNFFSSSNQLDCQFFPIDH